MTDQKEKHLVTAFGRMNPPTVGHMKLINKVKEEAEKVGARGVVTVSHSQDHKKNPLTQEQKLKHLSRFSNDVDFQGSSKESPTILHQLAKAHEQGHKHLTLVAGEDRVESMRDLVHQYNGTVGAHGHYNFKTINVVSSGDRDPDSESEEGASGTKQRQHAANNDFESFKKGLPSHIKPEHAKEMFDDVRQGMTPPPKATKSKKPVSEEYMEDLLSFSAWKKLDEVLSKEAPAGEWIKDFQDSDNPKFAGKSKEKRKQMALAAFYAKQRENK